MADAGFSVLKLFRTDGDIAMVTGGGDGIGRIASLSLGEAGAHVCVTDLDADAAERVAREIKDRGGKADAWALDVADNDAIVSVIAAIAARHGRIDILINNAGIAMRDATESFTLEAWNRIVQVNQTQVFLCSREVGRLMIAEGGGRMVNIASMMGLVGGGFYPNMPYHATKGAVVNMTRALAAEWARQGIRVNGVAPTFVRTRLTTQLQQNNAMMEIITERTPMGRMANVEEMAGAILYLASEASSMVTGVTLPVDGGWTAI